MIEGPLEEPPVSAGKSSHQQHQEQQNKSPVDAMTGSRATSSAIIFGRLHCASFIMLCL